MPAINPYLNFKGQTEEAFNFYKSVFGGEFLEFTRFKDAPEGVPQRTDNPELVLNVCLPIGKNTLLMGMDRPEVFGSPTVGDNFHISISADSADQAEKFFNGLSQGGKVMMPLEETFWVGYFGMLVDKYNIQWMVSFDSRQSNSQE